MTTEGPHLPKGRWVYRCGFMIYMLKNQGRCSSGFRQQPEGLCQPHWQFWCQHGSRPDVRNRFYAIVLADVSTRQWLGKKSVGRCLDAEMARKRLLHLWLHAWLCTLDTCSVVQTKRTGLDTMVSNLPIGRSIECQAQ